MTVQSSTRKQIYAGGQSSFVFTFRALVEAPGDINVTKTLIATGLDTALTYGVDYTVAVNSNGVGGTVTMAPTVSTAYTVTVYRKTTDTQESVYVDYNQFPASTLDEDLDKIHCLTQETAEAVSRSLQYSITSTASTAQLPTPLANAFIGWDATGTKLANLILPNPSTLVKATPTDAAAGTDDVRYMTALQVKTEVQNSGTVAIPLANVVGFPLSTANGGTSTTAGTNTASGVVTLDTSARLPAVDGSLLTGIAASKYFIGSFTRDSAAGSADVTYTGVGFKPKAIIFLGSPLSAANGVTWGMDTITSKFRVSGLYSSGLVFYSDNTCSIAIAITISDVQSGVVKTFDADGFTITWTKAGTPTGIATIGYLAIG